MKTIKWGVPIVLCSSMLNAGSPSNLPQFGDVYANDGLTRYRHQFNQEQQKREQRIKQYDTKNHNRHHQQPR